MKSQQVSAGHPAQQNRFSDDQFKVSGWCGRRPKCVAVAVTGHGVAVRDTKDSSKKTLVFTKSEWNAFVKGVKAGEFDTR